jgi:hypothetical protein
MRCAIRCTPGGLLRDSDTGEIICFSTYVAAEAEALRLTMAAHDKPRLESLEQDFRPVEVEV